MNEAPHPKALNPLDLMFQSSGVVLVVLLILIVASFSVWLIWFLKTLQVRRLRSAQQLFEDAATRARGAYELEAVARQFATAPGARVIFELLRRRDQPNLSAELLMSVAKRAIVTEHQRASSLMPLLSSIASASPFIGLFGTVWGIMDAFLQIGVHKSASLPVVAPAIGEALIATAFGLVAAIPATIGYNFVDQKITDLLSEIEASSETWVETLAADPRLTHGNQQPGQRRGA
jgi:biopolymer transport protein TolQ